MGWAKTLYTEALNAKAEQEKAERARHCRMAVNSSSLFLKRCQQAQAVHGNDSSPTSPTEPVRMGKRCSQLYRTDSVEGPEAVAWGLQMMAMMHPPGAGRVTILEQMDKARDDAGNMKRIRKGWQAFGVDDPWWVVHDKPVSLCGKWLVTIQNHY